MKCARFQRCEHVQGIGATVVSENIARPRSEAAHRRLLDAALEIVAIGRVARTLLRMRSLDAREWRRRRCIGTSGVPMVWCSRRSLTGSLPRHHPTRERCAAISKRSTVDIWTWLRRGRAGNCLPGWSPSRSGAPRTVSCSDVLAFSLRADHGGTPAGDRPRRGRRRDRCRHGDAHHSGPTDLTAHRRQQRCLRERPRTHARHDSSLSVQPTSTTPVTNRREVDELDVAQAGLNPVVAVQALGAGTAVQAVGFDITRLFRAGTA